MAEKKLALTVRLDTPEQLAALRAVQEAFPAQSQSASIIDMMVSEAPMLRMPRTFWLRYHGASGTAARLFSSPMWMGPLTPVAVVLHTDALEKRGFVVTVVEGVAEGEGAGESMPDRGEICDRKDCSKCGSIHKGDCP